MLFKANVNVGGIVSILRGHENVVECISFI